MKNILNSTAMIIALTIVSASAAAAQVGISVGGGPTFPVGVLAEEGDMGFNAQLSAGLRPALLPFGLRVDGAYNQLPNDHGHLRVVSGTVNGVFDLTVPGISPYVIAGLGVYNSKIEDDEEDHDHEATTNIGANVGAGLRIGLGRASFFVEGRFHNIFSEGEQARFVPLTIGVRF